MSLSKVSLKNIYDWDRENHGRSLILKLQEWDLIPNEKLCAQCQKPMSVSRDSKRASGFKWRCQKKNACTGLKCTQVTSITSGTLFEGMHVSVMNVVCFMLMWVRGDSLKIVREELHLSKTTSVKLSKLFREVVFNKMITKMEPIGGEGKVVEIDESKFGKRKYHRGRRVEGQWVFGGYERGTGLVFMVPVEKRNRETLLPIIHAWIKPGTTIHSDQWKAYAGLDNDPNYSYKHLTVNHSETYKDPITGACTNGIEGSWRPAKVHYNSSGRRKGKFDGNLAKYMFVKWCKFNRQDPFFSLIKASLDWLKSLESREIFETDGDDDDDEDL